AVPDRPAHRPACAVRLHAHGPRDRVLRRHGAVPSGHAAGRVRRLEARARSAHEHGRRAAAGGGGRQAGAGRRGAHVRGGGFRGRAQPGPPARAAQQPALMPRVRRPAPAAPGATRKAPASPRAADGTLPSAARALAAGTLALLALRALAVLLPGRWLWGIDLARDLPPLVGVAGLGVPLALHLQPLAWPLAALVPSGRR